MVSNYDKQVDMSRAYFLKYDQKALAEKFHLDMDAGYIYVTYLGVPYRIDRKTGAVYEETPDGYTECRAYDTVMTIYDMLCHGKTKELPPLGGHWTPIANFAAAGASPSADIFSQKYADAFSGKTTLLKEVCMALGGEILPPLAGADVTAKIWAFPFFPVVFQFWERDDEFAAQVKLLWDDQTMQYLHFETTYYLQGDLLNRLLDQVCGVNGDMR